MPSLPNPPNRELDPEALHELARVIGDDGVSELIQTFASDLPERLAEFQDGLHTGNLNLVARAVHMLKSSAAYMGGVSFSGLCATLEEAARSSNVQTLLQQEAEFKKRSERIEKELQVLTRAFGG